MKCEIIRDLFPSYIDELTSEESNEAVEEHLEKCKECRDYLEAMKKGDAVRQIRGAKKRRIKKGRETVKKAETCDEADDSRYRTILHCSNRHCFGSV